MFWFSVSQSDDRKSYIQFWLWPGLTAKYACLNKLTKKERECDSKKVIIEPNSRNSKNKNKEYKIPRTLQNTMLSKIQ